MLLINEDFRGYQSLLRKIQDKWKHVPGSAPLIRKVVKEWYEQNLIEAVIAASSLSDSPRPLALSEDNLTFASLPRVNVMNNINRVVARKIGGIKLGEIAPEKAALKMN